MSDEPDDYPLVSMKKCGCLVDTVTLRDRFALAFLNGWAANPRAGLEPREVAALAYTYASAMIDAKVRTE